MKKESSVVSFAFNNLNQGMLHRGQTSGPNSQKIQGDPNVGEHLMYLNKNAYKNPQDFLDFVTFAEVLMDNPDGSSEMVDEIADNLQMQHIKTQVCGPCFEPVDAITGKYYGMAFLSRWPITDYSITDVHPPDFLGDAKFDADKAETDNMPHSKYIQTVKLEINGAGVTVLNYHGIPFHRFKDKEGERVSLSDPRMKDWHKNFQNLFNVPENEPVIITGDFNNMNMTIEDLLPDLFGRRGFKSIVDYKSKAPETQYTKTLPHGTTDAYAKNQVDYTLVSPDLSPNTEAKAVITPSDHPLLIGKVEFG